MMRINNPNRLTAARTAQRVYKRISDGQTSDCRVVRAAPKSINPFHSDPDLRRLAQASIHMMPTPAIHLGVLGQSRPTRLPESPMSMRAESQGAPLTRRTDTPPREMNLSTFDKYNQAKIAENLRQERPPYADVSLTREQVMELIQNKPPGARLNLRKANLEKVNLKDLDLEGADLSDARMCKAHCRRTKLRGAILRHVDLREADLVDADLQDANLYHADLCGARLDGANFSRAGVHFADFRGASMLKVDFTDIRAQDTKFDDQSGWSASAEAAAMQAYNLGQAEKAQRAFEERGTEGRIRISRDQREWDSLSKEKQAKARKQHLDLIYGKTYW